MLEKCDTILIGGGMIFTFYRAMRYDIGVSLVENNFINTAKLLLKKAKSKGVKLILSKDFVLVNKFDNNANTALAVSFTSAPTLCFMVIMPAVAVLFLNLIFLRNWNVCRSASFITMTLALNMVFLQ